MECDVCFQEIIPIIIWQRKTFSTAVLALIVFGSLIIFPTILIPSTPSMWVAGMTFGYGYGFLLTIGAIPIGVSIPYVIGSHFYHRIHVRSCYCAYCFSELMMLWFLCSMVSRVCLFAGVARKVPKESFYHTTSRGRKLL